MFDYLLKIETLASKVSRWRALFFVAAGLLVVVVSQIDFSGLSLANVPMAGGGYIARVSIENTIGKNRARDALLSRVETNNAVKAVVLRIDSPGGTVGDSETVYKQIRNIAAKKPVVAVLENVAASGGYMVALAADHVVARNGTITGSIGVLSQYIGISELAKKLGISLKTIKTSELKASTSPLEELTPKSEELMREVVNDFHRYFVGLVAERRGFSEEEASRVADGRVFTGSQALKAGLVDEIGGEREALEWLHTNRNLDVKLTVKDLEYRRGIDSGGFHMLLTTLARSLYVALVGG
ncbi:signal peptide peptidase SppA [Candidatus Anaplasma sp. TIGMIC]|uniref:signal peptide peptidase SppA n=1 Tax=Candidatus Anaplasma sp. TIGMIC TaxID=3020713 RepID=UPI00232F3F28|nr:signal peptide peptidase SppA [Candidatus Anaplasma sp. TIGMIC]MDB1135210.1 signal peptide peptidase SppA [Candidatus Anaplasma sp. TIGMIC]